MAITVSAQPRGVDRGTPVFQNEDVVFYKIDDHTWAGNGHLMSNESLYIVEGNNSALLIDVGTNIKDLDKIVASITDKPVKLVATHVHPDHIGASVNYFDEVYIHPADTVNVASMMGNYRGKIIYMKEGDVFDLGGRRIEVVHTPGHTPGSVTFLDYAAGYGFSGDSFGSGNLLVFDKMSSFISTCEKMKKIMADKGIKVLYPGHFFGANLETPNELIPRRGVYVSLLELEGCRYRGVTNIGFRPTVTPGAGAALSIETHLLDFDRDIYGAPVTLEFLMRLRDERRFAGLPELQAQIGKDVRDARRYFRRLGSGASAPAGALHREGTSAHYA